MLMLRPEQAEARVSTNDSSLQARLLAKLLDMLNGPRLRFVLPHGEVVDRGNGEPIAEVRIRSARTLAKLLVDPSFEFAEGYRLGDIEVDGNLSLAIEEIYRRAPARDRARTGGRISRMLRRAHSRTVAAARRNIHHHYDLGNEFYALWLDPTLSYTCAYFPTDRATLEEAQTAKMHHVCRKLRLRPEESVVEAGCGWGSLALTMARDYGVKVRAFNISSEQISYAREAARREGLESRVEFVEDDYRNITGHYDAFVSVGMLEHVGISNYAELGRLIHRSLPRSGRGLIHSIGRNAPWPLDQWIERHIFPGAEVPSLRQMLSVLEPCELTVLDVENLRLHYARTLERWLLAFERSRERVGRMFDEKFVRMWRLYLAAAGAAFRTGEMQLFQVLFAPRENDAMPMTREYQYR
jgi:cyclopropane-fatty-acyl-phospholipid synthase